MNGGLILTRLILRAKALQVPVGQQAKDRSFAAAFLQGKLAILYKVPDNVRLSEKLLLSMLTSHYIEVVVGTWVVPKHNANRYCVDIYGNRKRWNPSSESLKGIRQCKCDMLTSVQVGHEDRICADLMECQGEFFLNLLSIRGLVLARNTNTGEEWCFQIAGLYNITQFEVFGCVYLDPVIPCQEIWILVSVQQDVTGIKPELLPSSNDALLMKARLKMPP